MSEQPRNRKGGEAFPPTRLSAIAALAGQSREERARAWETLAAAYWMPVYKYIRIRWNRSPEDAEDLAQGFFAEALDKKFFDRYDPSRARFRTFLRTCLDGFIANAGKSAGRIKRGGDVEFLPFDFSEAETQLGNARPDENGIDAYFDREFARSLFSLALDELRSTLRARGKDIHYTLFEQYVLHDDDATPRPGYRELADMHGIAVTDVTNYLAATRRDFRRILLDRLRELTASEQEFREEARSLLGVDPE